MIWSTIAVLQKKIRTHMCLFESIQPADAVRKLLRFKAAEIKYGRAGGLLNSIRVHDVCRVAGMDWWDDKDRYWAAL